MKLFISMHVGLCGWMTKLSCKKSGCEGIGIAESLSWNFSFNLLICDDLSLVLDPI